jgi:hypothetical protein
MRRAPLAVRMEAPRSRPLSAIRNGRPGPVENGRKLGLLLALRNTYKGVPQ